MQISQFKTEQDFAAAAPPPEGYYLRWIKRNEDGTATEYIKDHTGTVQVLNAGGSGGGGIPDAPADGKTYGRKDMDWKEITVPEPPTWHIIDYTADVTISAANGGLQKIVLTGDCAITPPSLSQQAHEVLLQIDCGAAARTVTIGADTVLDGKTGVWMIGWLWDGVTARRFAATEVV